MQIERLHERVAVRADFHRGVITPIAVARQNGQRFTVQSVSGRWVDRAGGPRGGAPSYHFTVEMGGAVYELAFQPAMPEWWLERVMLE
jgi:hypothetical protein